MGCFYLLKNIFAKPYQTCGGSHYRSQNKCHRKSQQIHLNSQHKAGVRETPALRLLFTGACVAVPLWQCSGRLHSWHLPNAGFQSKAVRSSVWAPALVFAYVDAHSWRVGNSRAKVPHVPWCHSPSCNCKNDDFVKSAWISAKWY